MGGYEIRNFVIISHVDHGKSTLADRFLELTATVDKRKMREQFLDSHPLEREKGITIKMQPVRMRYNFRGQEYVLNLIDTPGHADFSYEVSRALACVEGAILLVDATQGIQAQTLANLELARKANLAIIPAVNKIDLASAEVEKTVQALAALLEVLPDTVFRISAKEGRGISELLGAVIECLPPPSEKFKNLKFKDLNTAPREEAPLRALVFDSRYDLHQGVVAAVRIFEGGLSRGTPIIFMATAARAEALAVGVFLPSETPSGEIVAGEIGYVATGIKTPDRVRAGDTITKFKIQSEKFKNDLVEPLPGYQPPSPMVFALVLPEDQNDYKLLGSSLAKLKLEDAAMVFEPEESTALGRGFRAGFLGVLHLEIVYERLRRDYGLKLIFTSPSVALRVRRKGRGEDEFEFDYGAGGMAPASEISFLEEPWAAVELIAPADHIGAISALVYERGGEVRETANVTADRLRLRAEMPLREVISDFNEALKRISSGFASMAYTFAGFRRADLSRIEFLVNNAAVPALDEMVPRAEAYRFSRNRLLKLKSVIPPQLFSVPLQAVVDGRVIARETIPALKRDVTAHLYGGDRTRKMKLWQKQKRGKKLLAGRGKVHIPPAVFLELLKRDQGAG